ncbi:hypothetical protein EHM69_02995 [candidate division KSB1 bacterium]|nr:MAG: hypothetical protein EHM69_02995 [candidate division KSB1 bacterium]
MWNVIIAIAGMIVLLILFELLNLPEWIGQKLRGGNNRQELLDRLRALESRVRDLEKNSMEK